MRRRLSLSRVYGLLEPGPVVMVTTAHEGRANVMTLSWHTMIDFEPPLVGFVMSNRSHSFELLRAARECVISIPTVELAAKVVRVGNLSGRRIDKFERVGLTPARASRVKAPLVAECFANLECRVVDESLVDRYCLFVVRVLAAWVDPAKKDPRTIHHRGRGVFVVSGRTLKLPSRMK